MGPKANYIQESMRPAVREKGNKNDIFDPLPTEEEMKTPYGMEKLDSCLKGNKYLGGPNPTKVDSVAFASYGSSSQPSYWNYKYLCSWYHRMNTLTKQDLEKLPNGPGGMLRLLPAPLTLMDRWILSRMACAVETCNDGIEKYNFPQATTALYNFWLYELCDVYLEYLKPVFASGTSDTIATAKTVLWYCLNYALRLISPFMPYISEELYQRLPRKNE